MTYTPSPLRSKSGLTFSGLVDDGNRVAMTGAQGNKFQTQDATGTPVKSPLACTTTTQTLTVPSNAVSVTFFTPTYALDVKGRANADSVSATVYSINGFAFSSPGQHTVFTPATTNTITAIVNNSNLINPSGTIAGLTINLPSTPNNGDVIWFKFTQVVTAITWANGTLAGVATTAAANQTMIFVYHSATSKWY